MKQKLSLFACLIVCNIVMASSDMEYQARRLAEELLDGKYLIVRVYKVGENSSPDYTTARVRLRGLSFSHKDIKQSIPGISRSHIIVVTGIDQTNSAIAAVLDKYVSSNNFDEGKIQSIWPDMTRAENYKYLVFRDALGNPIPNAKVEVGINLSQTIGRGGYYSDVSNVLLVSDVLDSNGRYNLPLWSNTHSRLTYVVSHPNYGKVSVAAGGDLGESRSLILPLVPLDSEAASRSFRGYVVDDSGEPVISLPISLNIMSKNDDELKQYSKANGTVMTDENGYFSIYLPLEQNGELYTGLAPETLQYNISIRPPKSFNLLSYESMTNSRGGIQVGGEPKKIILRRLNPDQYFHTLTFRDDLGNIEDSQELESIEITVRRDQRVWQTMTYDEFKEGCYLYTGRLTATMRRWQKSLYFEEIELAEDSPEELELVIGREKIYQGTVIDGRTGKPVPDVLVVAGRQKPNESQLSMLNQQIDELRSRAKNEMLQGISREQLYSADNRVALTDQQGYYTFSFLTGNSDILSSFTAIENNHYAVSVYAHEAVNTNAQGICDVPVIELLPPQAQYPPVLVFEDSKGNVITDPNILDNIWIEIKRDDGTGSGRAYKNLSPWQVNGFTFGTYTATLNYGEYNYVYESVTITPDSPREILFKLMKETDRYVTVRGRVVHGITDEPMPDVLVFADSSLPFRSSASYNISEFYAVIGDKWNDLEPSDPIIPYLNQAIDSDSLTRTDSTGQYELQVERVAMTRSSFAGSNITAIEKNYMGARQSLNYMLPIDKNSSEPVRTVPYEPGIDGVINFPDMRMFPSGRVKLELNLPDMTSNNQQRTRVIFQYITSPFDTTPWLKKLWETPRERRGSSVIRPSNELRPNGKQTATLPAGVELTLNMYTLNNETGGIALRGIKLEQGQTLDLGLVEFPENFKVNVRVVDSQGRPVQGVEVSCIDEFNLYRGQREKTNSDGIASLYVTPNSTGQFVVACKDQVTEETLRESVFYEVKGTEDEGKEFLLRLPDRLLENLLK